MPGEVFGEADVILRVRLEELQGQLDQAEMMIVQQQQRVQVAQLETARSVQGGTQATDDAAGSLERLTKAGISAHTMYSTLRIAIVALKFAVAVATVAIGVGLVAALGASIDMANRTAKAIGKISDAAGDLDGTSSSVRRLAQELEKIPVFGGAASAVFRVFSGDVEESDRVLIKMIGTVEDGQVKLGGFRRALVNLVAPGVVSEIDDINDKLRIMNAELETVEAFSGFAGEQSGSLDDIALQASRQAELAQLEGIDRVRAENRNLHEDRMRQFDEAQVALNAQVSQQREEIRLRQDAEEITEREARAQRAALNIVAGDQQETLNQRRLETSRAITEVAQQRVNTFREEQRAVAELERLERDRFEAATRAAELRAGGRGFDAGLVELAQREQEMVVRAVRDGHQDRLDLIRRFYAARRDMVEQARADEMQAAREHQERQQQQLFDAMMRRMQMEQQFQDRERNLESQIRAGERRLAGDDFAARREEIQNDFQQRALEAIRNGDEELLDLLEKLRDIRLRQLEQAEQQQNLRDAERDQDTREGQIGETRQIDSALQLIGIGGDPKEEEKQMVREQKTTNQILKKQRAARAG